MVGCIAWISYSAIRSERYLRCHVAVISVLVARLVPPRF